MLILLVALQVVALLVRGAQLGEESHGLIGTTIGISVAAGLAAQSAPRSVIDVLRSLGRGVERSPFRAGAFLVSCSAVVFGANAFLQQPDAWDERGLLLGAPVIVEAGLDGFRQVYEHNPWVGLQHPPLTPILYAAAWWLGATTPLALRLLSAAISCLALLIVWRIGERFFPRRTAVLATVLLLTSPLVVRISSAVGNDPLLLAFFWLAILCGLRLLEVPSDGRAVMLGVVLALGFLTKYTMVLVAPILLALPWATRARWPALRHATIAVSIAAFAASSWACVLLALGDLGLQASHISRISTKSVSSWRFTVNSLFVFLPSALGIYSIPVLLRGLAHLEIRSARADAWPLLWIAVLFVPVTFTLSVTRFYMPAFPAVTTIMALGLLRGLDGDRAMRIAMTLAALCGVTLIYYGWADLTVRLRLF